MRPIPDNLSAVDLLIVGASSRAAAFSAIRVGLRVATADFFADEDLRTVARADVVNDWPEGIETWAAAFPTTVPLMYAGGLENEPALLDRIAATRPVFGIVGEPLRQVRSPESFDASLFACGFATIRLASRPEPTAGRWLVKPRKSGGGRGVRFWKGEGDSLRTAEFLQEFLDGEPCSAAYLATPRGVELLGMTRMLLPDREPLATIAPFSYLGSVTTDDVPVDQLNRLGESLGGIGLRGLFGVDFIRTGSPANPQLVPIEVNPRYTAGMEVLELRSGRSFVAEHVACFRDGGKRHAEPPAARNGLQWGKRIVYAPRALRVDEFQVPDRATILSGGCRFADIPAAGSIVPAGAPICTVIAAGEGEEECWELLKSREDAVLSRCVETEVGR